MVDQDLVGRSRLLSNVITSWLSHLLIIVTGFFLPRVLDIQLGQTMVGVWDFSWSIVAYVGLSHLGIGSALNRFVANFRAEGDEAGLRRATSTVSLIQFAIASITLVIVAATALLIPILFGEDLGDEVSTAQLTVLFLGISVAAQLLFDTSRGVLTGCHRWDLYNALYSGTQLFASVAMIGAVLLGYGLNVISFIYLTVIVFEGIARSFLAKRICPELSFGWAEADRKFAGEILKFGLKAFTMGIAPGLVTQGCSIMIASTLGPAALAIFARPSSLVRHIQTLVTRFTYVLTPMAGPILSKEGPKELKIFTISCSKYGLAFTLPAVVLFCLYGGDLIYFWMGEDYVNRTITFLLGVGFLLPLAQSALIRVMIGLDMHGQAARVSISMNLSGLFFGGLIVYYIGPSLEAYALLIAVTVGVTEGIAVPYFALRKMQMPVGYYLWNSFGRVVAICGISALIFALPMFQTAAYSPWILVSGGSYLLLVAIGYLLFLLGEDERKIIMNFIPGLSDR